MAFIYATIIIAFVGAIIITTIIKFIISTNANKLNSSTIDFANDL
jgi:hypothetical protein